MRYLKWLNLIPLIMFFIVDQLRGTLISRYLLIIIVALGVMNMFLAKGMKEYVISSLMLHSCRHDYCIECSDDGNKWKQMRVCHMHEGAGKVRFGIYACSPEDSSFTAKFTNMALTECAWKAHDGQKPDEE